MATGLNGKRNLRSKKGIFNNLYRTIDTALLPPPRHIEMSHAGWGSAV